MEGRWEHGMGPVIKCMSFVTRLSGPKSPGEITQSFGASVSPFVARAPGSVLLMGPLWGLHGDRR